MKRRIFRELAELAAAPLCDCFHLICFSEDDDNYYLVAIFPPQGKCGSANEFSGDAIADSRAQGPYAGRLLHLVIHLPRDYPLRPPELWFLDDFPHPYVDSSGVVRLDILEKQWSPALTMYKVVLSVISALSENHNLPFVPVVVQAEVFLDAPVAQHVELFSSAPLIQAERFPLVLHELGRLAREDELSAAVPVVKAVPVASARPSQPSPQEQRRVPTPALWRRVLVPCWRGLLAPIWRGREKAG